MKEPIDGHRTPRLARDGGGCLFDERVREFVGAGEGAAALEAIAAVRAAARFLHLLHERWAERQGLSDGRLRLLPSLGRCGQDGVSLGRLADLQGVTPRNITGLVDNLERAGLVERVPVSADRRSTHARPTPAGRERIEAIRLHDEVPVPTRGGVHRRRARAPAAPQPEAARQRREASGG